MTEGAIGLKSTPDTNALASATANKMKNLAELSIELWIELKTVRMHQHHPSKRLDYHHRASQTVGRA